MKATIISTDQVVVMKDRHGFPFVSRVWEGVTANGVQFVAYIPVLQVARQADNAEFERDLVEHQAPSADTARAIDARLVL